MKQDSYLVVSAGAKNGVSYSTLNRIVQGVKDNGDRYCFIDTKSSVREQEEMAIGQIVTYTTTRAAANAALAPQQGIAAPRAATPAQQARVVRQTP
jgi:hypothetical protein